MARAGSESQTTLQVKRRFEASRERVFRAWTEAAALCQWFFPSPDYTVEVPVLELRVGGTYQVVTHQANGNVHRLGGSYREIRPPEKLVFTWGWELEAGDSETLVTVEFHDLGGSTEIVLIDERFSNLEEWEKHGQGWTGCLDQLAKIFD
jgi:uncharacterized protein YndB with AHSA1/START domain